MNKTPLKDLLTRSGRFVPPHWIHNANGILNYLFVGWWMNQHHYEAGPRFPNRQELYCTVAQPFSDEPVTYLEFGVFRGESLRCWTGLLRHPDTRFFGFDSFEGLPESWVLACGKGAFDVKGELPVIEDRRVTLLKGWFSETLPKFLATFAPHPRLIVHLDADLYSSSIFVLQQLQPYLKSGTVLIFDEFFDRNHELKAFDEYSTDSGARFRCLGATEGLQQVAFQIL